jgi:hypothetical protein
MTKTVDDLRNEIRLAVDRFQRPGSTAFTKESLAAICDAVGHEIETPPYPPKPEMRATILHAIGERDTDDPSNADRPFRKAELEAIADDLQTE